MFKCIYKIRLKFSQGNIIDPYVILGVSKLDDFELIKKQYLKLVKEYHPDKNDSNKDIFIKIKNSFELIKLQKGLSTKKINASFVDKDEGFESVRPKYKDKFDKENLNNLNFEELYRKSKEDSKFDDLNKSFDTLRNMESKDFRFSTIDYEMRNTFQRFNIKNISCYIKKYSDSSVSIYVIIIAIILLFYNSFTLRDNRDLEKNNRIALNNLKNEESFKLNVNIIKHNNLNRFADDKNLLYNEKSFGDEETFKFDGSKGARLYDFKRKSDIEESGLN